VLSQVETDAACSSEFVKPQRLNAASSGEGESLNEHGDESSAVDIARRDDITPPGSVDMPIKAAHQADSKTSAELYGHSYMVTASRGLDAVGGDADTLSPQASQRSSGSDQAPAVRDSREVLHLVRIEAFEDDAASLFQEYIVRVDREQGRSLDCTWDSLLAHMTRRGAGVDELEWYWLAAASGCLSSTIERPQAADGLVVFRVVRGADVCVQVCHVSLAGTDWLLRIPSLLRALRTHIFRSLPAMSIRIKLWYANHEDGQFRLDRRVEAAFSQQSWRWFQLTNTSDGRRGQVMQLHRAECEHDSPVPKDSYDICISSCLFLPYSDAGNLGDKEHTNMQYARTASNSLVMAECLRRYALEQPVSNSHEDLIYPKLCKTCTTGDGEDLTKCEKEKDPEATQVGVPELVRRLARRGSVRLVRSKDTTNFQDCESWATHSLAAFRGLGNGKLSQDTETAWMTSLTPQLEAGGGSAHVMCGHVQICANWRDHEVELSAPSWVRVPTRALGQASTAELGGRVAYLATEDDNVFVIVWLLPVDSPEMGHDALYEYCRGVLRDAPPSVDSLDSVAGEVPTEVMLPRFHLQALAAAHVPSPIMKAGGFGAPLELLAARLSARLPPHGALKRRAQTRSSQSVLKMDSSFVFCVWHAHLDDLDVPLFAMVVHPSDWCE
jgi:hypothetical protein